MCGIAGVLGFGDCLREESLRSMAASLRHRGPDADGIWSDADAGIGFAHTRLSILDLSPAGNQPMISPSGRYVIVFNGEIYNHRDLREELETSGDITSWRGHSDTETLLAAIETWGMKRALEKAAGMFAFGVWDKETRQLTLARDRLGEKPLYYGRQGTQILFGSELKALKAHPMFVGEIDRDALSSFMRYRYIPAPKSIYQNIHKLRPGSFLVLRPGETEHAVPQPYWEMNEVVRKGVEEPFPGSEAEAKNVLESRLLKAVELQQISDVPLGAFLSGGVDSSMIAALMQQTAIRPVQTFTIGFGDPEFNEAKDAREVARHLGTDHLEAYVTSEDALSVIPDLPALYDEPFADPSQIPTCLLSRMTRNHVTVSLSGDGGDELFGGYNRYTWLRKLQKIPGPMQRFLGQALALFPPRQWDKIYQFVDGLLPESLRVRMPGEQAQKLASVLKQGGEKEMYGRLLSLWEDVQQLVPGATDTTQTVDLWGHYSFLDSSEQKMMAIDTMTFLPDDILCKVDRAAMGVSLETRVPYLDHRVVEFAWSLPLHMKIRNGQGKWILRELLYDYVPRELIERPKMGFNIPLDQWLRGPLRDWAENLLDESRIRQEGFLNATLVQKKWKEHLSGKWNWQYPLWNVLMFQAWLNMNHTAGVKN
ncbi:MAG: asparagine synthase (glutamine-hydrolyzing) [Balneolaceae bacterium]